MAIEIPSEIRSRLRDLIEALRPELPGARWARPEGIHLTLKFLGEVSEQDVRPLVAELERRVTGSRKPFSIEVGGLGTFPSGSRPRVLWVGLEDPSGSLAALQPSVEEAVMSVSLPGVARQSRPFRPHLTLARLAGERLPERFARRLDSQRDVACGTMPVTSCALIRSHLGAGGSRYETLSEIPL